jgi:hypothetical protein
VRKQQLTQLEGILQASLRMMASLMMNCLGNILLITRMFTANPHNMRMWSGCEANTAAPLPLLYSVLTLSLSLSKSEWSSLSFDIRKEPQTY